MLAFISISVSVILGLIVVVLVFGNQVSAQVDPNDRFFEKNFCSNEETLLDGLVYSDLTELSYDSTGCPISLKIIHRWNEISTSDKTIITSRMATNGYSDITSRVQVEALRAQ